MASFVMQTECIELTLHRFVSALQNPELQLLIARQMNNVQTVFMIFFVSPQEWPATLEQMGIVPNLAAAAASAVAAQPVDLASSPTRRRSDRGLSSTSLVRGKFAS